MEAVAVCATCEVRVSFMEGFEPDLSDWRDGSCPACVRRDRQFRVSSMTAEEQRELVMEEIRRDPTASIRRLCQTTLVERTTVVGVRNMAVRDGTAAPTVNATRVGTPANREKAAGPRRRDRRADRGREQREADLAYLRAHPGIDRNEFADGMGITRKLATARLGRLVRAGQASRRSTASKRAVYEAV